MPFFYWCRRESGEVEGFVRDHGGFLATPAHGFNKAGGSMTPPDAFECTCAE